LGLAEVTISRKIEHKEVEAPFDFTLQNVLSASGERGWILNPKSRKMAKQGEHFPPVEKKTLK
jgi:hypothetical protein